MNLSNAQAKQSIHLLFYSNWIDAMVNGMSDAEPALVKPVELDYVPAVKFENIELGPPTEKNRHFVRLSTSNLSTTQSSLAGGRVNGGGTKYTTPGIATVQIFFSKQQYSSEEEDFLSSVAQNIFLIRRVSGVWFRDVTVRQVPPEEDYLRVNVEAQYEFDSVVKCPVT